MDSACGGTRDNNVRTKFDQIHNTLIYYFELIENVALTEAPVIISGPSGTGKDLESLVKQNRFRDDLYFRINVFPSTARHSRNM